MTHIQRTIHASLETRDRLSQATLEAAALAGDLGIDSQILAMSEQYKMLKAAGQLEAAAILKGRALAIAAGRK